MKYSDSEIENAQRSIFNLFLDDLAKTYTKRKKFTSYTGKDLKALHKELNDYLINKKKDEDDLVSIGYNTLKDYQKICKNVEERFRYNVNFLNALVGYIDHPNPYDNYDHYVERNKVFIKLKDVETSDLIYSRSKSKRENDSSNTFDYMELSYELLPTLNEKQIGRYIKFYLKEVDDIKFNDKANFWLGVLLLHKRQYYHALKYLEKSIDLNPINEEYHYNLALAKFKGRIPFILRSHEIESIEIDLINAVNLNVDKRKFYELQYIIQENFYQKRSLRYPHGEISLTYLNSFKKDEIELQRLLDILKLPDFFN